jgi:tRNA dimethylallyltransferase
MHNSRYFLHNDTANGSGTTGVGKTQLSIDLAKALNGQIINGDSMQIYRTADVLTNKVTKSEMCGIKHHLLDFLDPSETYDVYNFEKAAVKRVTLRKSLSNDRLKKSKTRGTGRYLSGEHISTFNLSYSKTQ